MSATELDYQAILDRIVAIYKADSNLWNTNGSKLREIRTGVYEKGKFPYPAASVTLANVSDTFYDTGILTSNYVLYISVTIWDQKKDAAKLEASLAGFAYYAKLDIKNNVKLGTPGAITTDTKVDRCWPWRMSKYIGYSNDQIAGAYNIMLRATMHG